MKSLFQPLVCLLLLLSSKQILAQSIDEIAIRQLLNKQTLAWNAGDKKAFMEGYWKNDSLMFIGKSGVTYGWQNTLDRYEINYPDSSTMGKLHFDLIEVKRLSAIYFYVTGKWYLSRSIGDISGHYTLLLRKIKGRWYIVTDHSS